MLLLGASQRRSCFDRGKKKKEFYFEHLKFEMSMKYPSRDIKQDSLILELSVQERGTN